MRTRAAEQPLSSAAFPCCMQQLVSKKCSRDGLQLQVRQHVRGGRACLAGHTSIPAAKMAQFTKEELELAEPTAVSPIAAWYMDSSDHDQREPHQLDPPQPVPLSKLAELGVLYWHMSDPDNHESDPKLAAIRKVRGYSYVEIITISKDTLPGYEEKLKIFYQEHIHSDEEIRYILDGAGYFDVRDLDDRWIRIHCRKGDLIVLPEGIYHRFTLDSGNYAKAMRLFVGEPVWTPFNRPQEEHPSRAKYLAAFSPAAADAVAANA